MNRRDLLSAMLSLAAVPLLGSKVRAESNGPTGDQALRLLKDGNKRYIDGLKTGGSGRGAERRSEVATSQSPHAIILGCADSRVAPEVFFDSGIGELFVVRVAGNIVSGSNYGVVGSCEYAAAVLNSPLLVILGHENCGAVKAAIDTVDRKTSLPGAIEDIVESIRPAAEATRGKPGDSLHNAIEENVRHGMTRVRSMSSLLDERIRSSKLKLVGGIYDLASGSVRFLD